MICDGTVVRQIREPLLNTMNEANDMPEVKSPDISIWPGRNAWHTKDKIQRYYYGQMNRFKQEVLIETHRAIKRHRAEYQIPNTQPLSKEVEEQIKKKTCDLIECSYHIGTSDAFVLNIAEDEWHFTEPYNNFERERLIECLYRFVEYNVALSQIMKAFDLESQVATLALGSLQAFVNQNALKTYRSRYLRVADEKANAKVYAKFCSKQTMQSKLADIKMLNDNNIMWFYDVEAYKELGETVMQMVGLLLTNETYKNSNYTPKTIFKRI